MKTQLCTKEITAVSMLLAGVVMAFTALLLPPQGEIHESVLYLFAQILIYAGSVFGMDCYIRRITGKKEEEPTAPPEKP